MVADRLRWLGRLERAAQRTRKGNVPESVHDVRVAIRQLQAWLDLWRSILSRRPRRGARRTVGALP
jgi:CHAD domain-containing protein